MSVRIESFSREAVKTTYPLLEGYSFALYVPTLQKIHSKEKSAKSTYFPKQQCQ